MSETHEKFEQNTKGWAGSGFRNKLTALRVRRCQSDGRDEAQIEIHICEVKPSGRLHSTCSSFKLTPDEAARFAEALLTQREEGLKNMANEALMLRQQAREVSAE